MRVLLIATAFLAAFVGIDAKCWPVSGSCVDSTAQIFINTINDGPDTTQLAAFADSFLCAFSQYGIHWHGAADDVTHWLSELIDTFGQIFTNPDQQTSDQIAANVNNHWSLFQELVNIVTGGHLAEFVASPVAKDFLNQVVTWKNQLLTWSSDPSTFWANAKAGGDIYHDLVSKFVAAFKAFNAGACAGATAQIFINTINNGPDVIQSAAFSDSFICAFDQAWIDWDGTPDEVDSWFTQLIGTFDQIFTAPDKQATAEITTHINDHWSVFQSSIDTVTGGHLADYVKSPAAKAFLAQVVPWKNQLLAWANDPSTFAANAQAGGKIYSNLVPMYVTSLKAFLEA